MKKKILIVVIGLVSALITLGAIFGVYMLLESKKEKATIEDSDALYQTKYIEIDENTKSPDNYNPKDVVSMALWRVKNTSSFMIETSGNANASVANQKVSNLRIVKDNQAYLKTVSSGLIKFGNERFVLKDSNKYLYRETSKLNKLEPVFNDEAPACYSMDKYIETYGWSPFLATGYIICDETYLEEPTMVKNSDNTYTISLKLNPNENYAPFWYRREVLTSSSSSIIPEFKKIEIEYTVNEDYQILKGRYQETYVVKAMGFTTSTSTDVTDVFTYDNVEFNDSYNYFKNYLDLKEDDTKVEKEESALNLITNTLASKETNFKCNLSTNDLNLNGILSLNLNDLSNIQFKANLNDLYIEYSDYLYLSYGNIKLKANLNNLDSSFDASSLIEELENSTIKDYNTYKTIESKLSLDNISIELLFKLNENEMDSISAIIKYNDLAINVNLTSTIETLDEVTKTDYYLLNDSKELLDDILNIFNTGKLNLIGKFNYNEVNVEFNLLFDIKNKELNSNINISYNDNLYNINLKYFNKYNDLINVIYLEFNNIKGYLELNKLSNILNIDTSGISINDVLKTIDLTNLKEIVEYLIIKDNNIEASIKTDTLEQDIKDLLNILDKINIKLYKDNDLIKLNITQYNINISLSNDEFEITYPDDSYINLYLLLNNGYKLFKTLYNNYSNISLDGTINYNNTNITIDSNIKTYISKDNLLLDGIIELNINNTLLNVKFSYQNNVITISLLNTNIKLTIDEVKELISLIGSEYNIELNQEIDIDSILNSIALAEKGINIKCLENLISELNIVFNENDINISNDKFKIDLNIGNISKFEIEEYDSYLNYSNVEELVKIFNNIYKIYSEKKTDLSFDLSIYDNDIKHLDIVGNLKLEVIDINTKDINLYLNGSINEYENNEIKVTHNLEVVILSNDSMVYITYSNSTDQNKLMFSMKYESLLNIINDVLTFMNLDFTTIDLDNININDIVNKIYYSIDSYIISLNNNYFVKDVNNDILITINKDGNLIKSNDIYTTNNTKLVINSLEINELKDYNFKLSDDFNANYDISDIDKLTNSIINMLTLDELVIEGNAKLSITSLINITVPLKITIINNDKLMLKIHLDVPKVGGLFTTLLKKKSVDIYYYNKYIYIDRLDSDNNSYQAKLTLAEFTNNIYDYLFDFALGMPESVINLIKNNQSTDTSYVIKPSEVINSYSYSDNSYNVSLSMSSLTGNSDLGDLSASVNLSNVILDNQNKNIISSITGFKFTMVKVIDLKCDSLKVTNIDDNLNILNNVDIDSEFSFILNNTLEVNTKYKNGSKE